MKLFRVLSLGGGTQSSAVLLMSARSMLPKLDAAVFADTQWEPPAVYENVAWLKEQAAKAGIPVLTITKGNLREHTLNGFVRGSAGKGERYASLPLYTRNPDTAALGQIRRQCTREYKVEPIELWIKRTLLGLRPRQRVPAGVMVEKWFGMSADEASRLRSPSVAWQRFAYPLCRIGPEGQELDRVYNRGATISRLGREYPGRAFPRSACIGCPFHSNAEWRIIRRDPKLWADACEVDAAIRHADGMRAEVFLHRSCKPLADAALGTDLDDEPNLWNQECQGMCGV